MVDFVFGAGSILISAFWVILAITILVFIHELGHFLSAKYFGMRVDRFSVGFPPNIFGKKFGETEYVIGLTPLGGYVKIAGMVDESMDTDQLHSEPDPREYRAKPVWQRMIVITAGVIFNMILAAIIFTGLAASEGEVYVPAERVAGTYVADSSLAYRMGMRTGDDVIAINGERIERFTNLGTLDVLDPSNFSSDRLTVTVRRDGEDTTLTAPENIITQLSEEEGQFGLSVLPSIISGVADGSAAEEQSSLQSGDRIVSVAGDTVRYWAELVDRVRASGGVPVEVTWFRSDSLAQQVADSAVVRRTSDGVWMQSTIAPQAQEGGGFLLGVSPMMPGDLQSYFGAERETYGPVEAVGVGVEQTWNNTVAIVTQLKRLVTGRDDLMKSVGGPVKVAQFTSQAAAVGAGAFWRVVALLSITLAVMNILPIPALDGGHLVFLLYEAIFRREPSEKVRMALQQVGMVLLLCLMIFLVVNDLLRL